MKILVDAFGKLPDGRTAQLYTLENDNGMRAKISDLGGTIVSLEVPDRDGNPVDVALGHEKFEDYLKNPGYFGALVGRNSNRIRGGVLELGGQLYQLEQNDGEHNLHSGKNGLSHQLLNAEARTVGPQPALLLTHTLENGSDGFPGNLTVSVVYTVTNDDALLIDYRAVSDADTIINLTNHNYFNLGGHASGPVYDQTLQLDADFYNPGTAACLPTGEILQVEGTPFDFREPKPLGDGIQSDAAQIQLFGGYDHNFLLNGHGYRRVATVCNPGNGLHMEVSTNLPAIQLYSGNSIDGWRGKGGARYGRHQGFCLETQFVPNAVYMPWLLSPIFRAGEECVTTTGFQFYCK